MWPNLEKASFKRKKALKSHSKTRPYKVIAA